MAYEYPYDDWAEIYDAVYADLTHDLDFYTGLAEKVGGPVLELGCGTGRVSLAIAAKGIDVVGVDISPLMVAAAQAKATERKLTERCIFQTGDMADVHLADTYPLVIMPFRSFQSMLTVEEQKAALATASAHLRDGGTLALDVFQPDIGQLGIEHDETVPFHMRDVKQADGGTIVVWGQNGWDGEEQVNSARLIIEELDPKGLMVRRLYRDFDLRYTFRYEMQHLLDVCGFDVDSVAGDFDGGPVTEESDDIVWVARKAGRGAGPGRGPGPPRSPGPGPSRQRPRRR